MASNITKDDYVMGQRSGVYGTVHFPDFNSVDVNLRQTGRQVLWETLNEFKIQGGEPLIKISILLNNKSNVTNVENLMFNF